MNDSPELAAIRVNAEMRRIATDSLPGLLRQARAAGCSWDDIVKASGLSRAHVFRLVRQVQSH